MCKLFSTLTSTSFRVSFHGEGGQLEDNNNDIRSGLGDAEMEMERPISVLLELGGMSGNFFSISGHRLRCVSMGVLTVGYLVSKISVQYSQCSERTALHSEQTISGIH